MRSAPDDVEIFYVDDVEDEIVITELNLRRQKLRLEIRFHMDAAEMLATLDQRRQAAERLPGLIVTDLNMPGMSGLQLLQKLRAEAAYRDVVIGVCTGSENLADHAAVLAAGGDFVVVKPFDRGRLAQICETTGRFRLVEEAPGKTRLCQAAA
ncbi:MAG: response regulator [Alphaproteobacteria bacterium]